MPLKCLALEGGRLVGGGFTIGEKCLIVVLVVAPAACQVPSGDMRTPTSSAPE